MLVRISQLSAYGKYDYHSIMDFPTEQKNAIITDFFIRPIYIENQRITNPKDVLPVFSDLSLGMGLLQRLAPRKFGLTFEDMGKKSEASIEIELSAIHKETKVVDPMTIKAFGETLEEVVAKAVLIAWYANSFDEYSLSSSLISIT